MLDLLATVAVLGLVGSLGAMVLLGGEARNRRLDLVMAVIVCTTAAGLAVAIGLGAAGQRRTASAAAEGAPMTRARGPRGRCGF